MTLYRDAKKVQSAFEGVYNLSPMMVNGKSYWIHASGDKAIWFSPDGWLLKGGGWCIGDIASTGKYFCSIFTRDAVSVPQKASVWKYNDFDGKWKCGQGQVSVSLQN